MSSPLGSRYSEYEYRLPSIMVTPALPSPRSLPKEMRSTLDSILTRRPSPPLQRSVSSIRRPRVPVVEDRAAEYYKDEEVPHAPSTTHSAAADRNNNYNFRLDLDFENVRFSCGDVLAAMNAAGESALARRSAVVRNRAAAEDAAFRARATSRPQSPWEDDYVMVSNMMSLYQEDDDDDDDSDYDDSGVELARPRPQSPSGQVPQAWRHAMYISKVVWPSQKIQAIEQVYRNKPLPPVIPTPRSRWAEAGMMVRKLSLRRS